MTAGFLWGAPWRQREVTQVLRAIQRTALLIGIGIIVLLTIFPNKLGSRLAIYSETLMPNSPTSELVHRTQTYPLHAVRIRLRQSSLALRVWHWYVHARRSICDPHHACPPMHIGVEIGYGNLLLELGIAGLVLWIVLGLSIATSAWKVVVELRSTPWFPLAFSICLYAILLFFPDDVCWGHCIPDFALNAYFWLLQGILYRLREFPKAVHLAKAQVAPRQG